MLFLLLAVLSGCTAFHPRPITPVQTASAFEARTLDNPGLKAFLEHNLHHEVAPWPPGSWDLLMLTLAAFYYHPDLDVARAQWGVAEAGIITARGRPNPSVGTTPGYNSDAAGGVSPWILGFALDLPIEIAGKRGYRIAQARQLSESARLNIATVAWQVRSRLRTALFDLYAAAQTESLLQDQQTVQTELVTVLERRLASGEVSQPDVTQARIALSRTRLALHGAQQQHAEARVRCADALGVPVTALDGASLTVDALEQFPLTTALPAPEVRHQALLNRSDILSGLAAYAATQSALRVELAKQYPDIHLGPGYSFDQGENKWSVGLALTLPVFNRNRGPIAEAIARREESAARFTARQTQVIGEIDLALAGYSAARRGVTAADSLLAHQEQQHRTTQAMFQAGAADRLELLSARVEYGSVALDRIGTLMRAQHALGALEDAVQRPLDRSGIFPAVPETNPRTTMENQK